MSFSSTSQLNSRRWLSRSSVSYGIAPGEWNSIRFVSTNKLKQTSEFEDLFLSVKQYLYHEGRYFGRNRLDLLRVCIFYFVFYALLALFMAALLTIFMFGTMTTYKPSVTGHSSLLKLNPGVSIVPSPDHLTSLIHFRTGRKYAYRRFLDPLIAFLQWYEDHGYKTHQGNEITVNCRDGQDPNTFDPKKLCYFDLNMGGQCNIYDDYGYDDGLPCFAVRLNRIYGWLPEPLDNETGVLIKCNGINDEDRTAMGDLCYYDSDTINKPNDVCKSDYGVLKSYFFPYLKQSSYASPFVFIKFLNPMRKVVIMMECHAIAKNIEVDISRRIGSMTFELLVD